MNESPLRIWWITETFFPPIVGGQELLAHALTQGLARKGASVAVITRQTVPPSAEAEWLNDVHVQRISPAGFLKGRGWKALFPLLHYLAKLGWLLARQHRSYDVVIISSVKLMPLVVVPICRILGKTCILRAESIFELSEAISTESMQTMGKSGGNLLLSILTRLRTFALRRASTVVAISSEIRRKLVSLGVRGDHIADISNAVDLARFRPSTTVEKSLLKQTLGLPPDRIHSVYVGRLSRAKGLPMLIEAWPTIRAAHPDLCLLLVGSGNASFDNCEPFLREFVRDHGLENDVLFLGEKSQVEDYLRAADLFIFPSEYEGFSLVLVEAMACGLPGVVTRVGAAPDLIEHGESGYLFPPKDAQALKSAVAFAMARSADWNAVGARAHSIASRYDLPVITDRYLELCERLTGRSAS